MVKDEKEKSCPPESNEVELKILRNKVREMEVSITQSAIELYSSFKSKKEFPHVIRLSPINGGFIQIVCEMLWQQ